MHDARLVRLFFCCACWLAAACGAAPVGDPAAGVWSLVRRDGDVDIYRRPLAGSDLPEMRGHTRFPAAVSEVFGVVSDYDHFAGFIPLVSESRVLETGARSSRVYQRLDLPLPFADRHYIIRVENDLQGQDVIDISWQFDSSRSASLPTTDALLPDAFSGSWHLEARPGGAGSDAVYTIHVEPGGLLPDWLFVRVTERYVVQVMNAVRQRLADHGR